jgi:hypothetical protein
MKTKIAATVGSSVLGGAVSGRALFAQLAALAQERPSEPRPWCWDFDGVEVVSASFIRESFVSVRALLRAQRSTLVPVVVNANADVREDLHVGFTAAHDVIVIGLADAEGGLSGLDLIGDLDPHLRSTFRLVAERVETDAKELKEFADTRPGSSPIVQTAWNNRLAKLVELGALVEVPRGRAKRYRLIA